MITVSIITTYYNAAKHITRCINSIFSQIIENYNDYHIEYVLVNDCSTDNTKEVINNYISEIEEQCGGIYNWITIKMIDTPNNIGCGGARKFGIDNSTGEYLMFLDSDDYYIHNDFVQRALNDIISTKSDIVEYGMKFNRLDGNTKDFVANKQYTINGGHDALIALYKLNIIKFHVWTKICTRTLSQLVDYSIERTYEDVITIPRWLAIAEKITVMSTVEINYSATENSIIRENIQDTRIGTCKAILMNCPIFKKDIEVLVAMYIRAFIDISNTLENKTSNDPGFNEMSEINTKLLSYIYPDSYKDKTFNIIKEDD